MPSTASPPWTQTQAEDLGYAPTSSSTLEVKILGCRCPARAGVPEPWAGESAETAVTYYNYTTSSNSRLTSFS